MHVEPNPARALGDERALLERVVDPLDAVIAHRQQEATETKHEDQSMKQPLKVM